jgi:hypothetical protein
MWTYRVTNCKGLIIYKNHTVHSGIAASPSDPLELNALRSARFLYTKAMDILSDPDVSVEEGANIIDMVSKASHDLMTTQ